MKERELREHAVCDVCGEKIGASKLPMFAVVTLRRYHVKLERIQRQDGLVAMLGGHAGLAMAMGPDEDLAEEYDDPMELTICATCHIERELTVAELIAIGVAKEEAEAAAT